MMNPQFQGMRYAPQYQSMDPQMVPMQPPQPQHPEAIQAASPTGEDAGAGAPSPVTGGEGDSQQPDDASQQSAQQQQFQMQYGVPPPGAYYAAGGMPMHPRGPQYPGQFVGNPQQMPVVPGGGSVYPVYPMQPGGMPPNMHMRGPTGNPYYGGPGAPPVPYGGGYGGHGMMEDGDPNFRGGRGGRGPGRGGRGRRNGRGGRGGGGGGRGPYYGGRGQPNPGSPDAASAGNDSKQQPAESS